MVNAQLECLNRSMLEYLRPSQACLVMEPLSLSRKHLGQMQLGDWIDLGPEEPEFMVRQGTKILYAAHLREGERGEEVLLTELNPISLFEDPGKKRVILEGRLAILPHNRLYGDEIMDFPWKLSEHIHLFVQGRWIAASRIIMHSGGYALEITELNE